MAPKVRGGKGCLYLNSGSQPCLVPPPGAFGVVGDGFSYLLGGGCYKQSVSLDKGF